MTDIDITDEKAVEILQDLVEARDDSVHESLAVHWLAGETEVTREEAEDLLEEYARYDTDKYDNEVVVGVVEKYEDLADAGEDDDADAETSQLETLDGIGEGKADALRDADINTVEDVLNASKEELMDVPGISQATAEKAKKDATRFVDSIEVTAADCAERERSISERTVEQSALELQVPSGEPSDEHFKGLPVLEDPDEVEGTHPFVKDMGHDYYSTEVKGVSLGFGNAGQTTFETDNTDVEVACKILADDDFCLALRGQTGTGKNVLLKYISAMTNRPVVRVNFGQGMTYADLVGEYTLESDDQGNQVLKWVDGLLTLAARYGWIFIADEMNAAPPECTMPLHAVTEEDPELTLKKKGEVLKPHPSFRFVATMNPPEAGKYGGTNKMNEAFKTRFYTIDIDYLPQDEETSLVHEKVNADRHVVDKEDIQGMVKAANRLRDRAREGENLPTASTREIIKAAKLSDIMDSKAALQTVLHGMMEPEHDAEGINETVQAYL